MTDENTRPKLSDSDPAATSRGDVEALERALNRRFDELAALTRQLEAARQDNQLLRQEQARWKRQVRLLNRKLDALGDSLSGRLGHAVMRLLMAPGSLGRGPTLLDDIDQHRRGLVR